MSKIQNNAEFKNCRGVIFDLDRTLVNTIDDLGLACDYLLKKAGRPLKWSVDDYRQFVGNGAKLLVKRAFEDTLSDEELERQYELFKPEYDAIKLDHAYIYPGIKEVLEGLKAAHKKLIVCTNKPNVAANGMIEALFGKDVFDIVRGNVDGKPKKPDPTVPRELIASLGVLSDECVWVGDSDVDILSAQNLGCKSIGVTWGFRSRKLLESCGADVIIDEPKNILKTFDIFCK